MWYSIYTVTYFNTPSYLPTNFRWSYFSYRNRRICPVAENTGIRIRDTLSHHLLCGPNISNTDSFLLECYLYFKKLVGYLFLMFSIEKRMCFIIKYTSIHLDGSLSLLFFFWKKGFMYHQKNSKMGFMVLNILLM